MLIGWSAKKLPICQCQILAQLFFDLCLFTMADLLAVKGTLRFYNRAPFKGTLGFYSRVPFKGSFKCFLFCGH